MLDIRGTTAVVGVAESDLGEVGAGRFAIELAAQASVRALRDAGLTTRAVDGLFSVVSGKMMSTLDVAEYLGIQPRYTDSTMIGGSAFLAQLHHAAVALSAGVCDVALITYGSTARSDSSTGRLSGVPVEEPDYERPFQPMGAVSRYALAAQRHMHQYGTTRTHLAEVAVAARAWAGLNPVAFKRTPLTIDEVLARPFLSTPFTALDCCLVTDGGGAVVMVRAERAPDLPSTPVYVLGAGETHTHRWISQMPDLTTTGAVQSGARAFAMAGLTPADVDVVQLYDAFTINPILFLEDLGFCVKGEGGEFVSDGRIAPGGELPVNTNGGGLSYCHPGMYGIFAIIEAVRQVRGDSGERQQSGVEVALAHGNGGHLSSQATAIFGSATTR